MYGSSVGTITHLVTDPNSLGSNGGIGGPGSVRHFPIANENYAVDFTGSAASGIDSTSYLFTDVGFGAAATSRIVLVGFTARSNIPATIDAVTIGGVAAMPIGTVVENTEGGNRSYAFFYAAAVPEGSTGAIEVEFSQTMLRCSASVWRLIGYDIDDLADEAGSAASNPSASVDVPAPGAVFAVCYVSSNAAASAVWTGADELVDTTYGGEARYAAASRYLAAGGPSHTVTATLTTGAQPAMKVITLGVS